MQLPKIGHPNFLYVWKMWIAVALFINSFLWCFLHMIITGVILLSWTFGGDTCKRSYCLSSKITWSKGILVRWLGTKSEPRDKLILNLGLFAFVYYLSTSRVFSLLSVSRVSFVSCFSLFIFKLLVCLKLPKIWLPNFVYV